MVGPDLIFPPAESISQPHFLHVLMPFHACSHVFGNKSLENGVLQSGQILRGITSSVITHAKSPMIAMAAPTGMPINKPGIRSTLLNLQALVQ
jgi:hypothetical protein